MTMDAREPYSTGVLGLLGGRYELGDLLGTGGMADVYAAHDRLLDRDVAIKFFRPVNDRAGQARFVGEARLLAGLAHPALVMVYDACLDGDQRPYLVTRLVDGGTLRQRISNHGPLPPDEVARLGARLAGALAYVHNEGIVHRDVKPSNVLIDSTGACYLADFGLAWSLGSSRFTNSGVMVGTACYLAPEQVTGAIVDQKADVYALGLVLLECLTGWTEYGGTEVEAAVARLSRQPVVPDEFGASWRHLLTAMTAYLPADRPDAAAAAYHLDVLTHTRSSPQDTPRLDTAPTTEGTYERTAVMPHADRVDLAQTKSRSSARRRWVTTVRASLGAVGAAAVALAVGMMASASTVGQPTPDDAPRGAAATPAQRAEAPQPTRADPARRAASPTATHIHHTAASLAKAKAPQLAKAGKPAAKSKPDKGRAADAGDGHGKNRHGKNK